MLPVANAEADRVLWIFYPFIILYIFRPTLPNARGVYPGVGPDLLTV
jgi:hypothetical protein